MRAKLLAVLTLGTVLSLYGITLADDEVKKSDKPDAKKEEGKPCPGPRTDACPKDGCCDGEAKKGEAKKDDAKKDDDCECCKEKSSGCSECAKSKEGCCKDCQEKIESGAVAVIPVKGMACGACEAKVTAAVKGVEGVNWAIACSQKNAGVFSVAPGKSVKLSQVEAALKKTDFSLDETAALKGRFTLEVKSDGADWCTLCEVICKVLGIEDCKGCCEKNKLCDIDEKTKTASFPVALGLKTDVSLKKLRDALTEKKFTLSEVVIHGPKDDAKKS